MAMGCISLERKVYSNHDYIFYLGRDYYPILFFLSIEGPTTLGYARLLEIMPILVPLPSSSLSSLVNLNEFIVKLS